MIRRAWQNARVRRLLTRAYRVGGLTRAEARRASRDALRATRAQSGQALVEIALCLPVLAALMLGGITGGIAVSRVHGAQNGAQSAANYWTAHPDASPDDVQAYAVQHSAPAESSTTATATRDGDTGEVCTAVPWRIEAVILTRDGTARSCSTAILGGQS